LDYDKILILDKGHINQYGTPMELINVPGIFQEMCKESNEFDKLLRMANTRNIQ
jgi:ABC-type multidrug transport system fused ATPase/permease subunit